MLGACLGPLSAVSLSWSANANPDLISLRVLEENRLSNWDLIQIKANYGYVR